MKRNDLLKSAIVLSGLLIFPLHGNVLILHFVIISLIWAIVVVNWNVLMGFAGVFSFAQVAFFSVGAYSYTMLIIHVGAYPWLWFFVAGFLTAIASLLIGLLTLRLRSVYVALFTFGFHQILRYWIVTQSFDFTGGDRGLAIPTADAYQYSIGPLIISFFTGINYYYLTLAIFLVSMFIMYKILHSRTGLAFRAIRDNEERARTLGVSALKYKLLVFSITSFFIGIAGAHYANYTQAAAPSFLDFGNLVLVLAMLVVGGYKHFYGPVFGALVVNFIFTYFLQLEAYRFIIAGGLIVAMVLLLPQGLGKAIDKIRNYTHF